MLYEWGGSERLPQMLGKAKDATFELIDSIMTTGNIYKDIT